MHYSLVKTKQVRISKIIKREDTGRARKQEVVVLLMGHRNSEMKLELDAKRIGEREGQDHYCISLLR